MSLAYVLSEDQLRLRTKPVILIALLNVCHGGDAGKHSYILPIRAEQLQTLPLFCLVSSAVILQNASPQTPRP